MADEKRKELVLFAGPNGSGKSTVINFLLEQEAIPRYYICPDNNLDKRYANDKNAYIKAMEKAEEQRYEAVDLEKSFTFESVFSTREKLEFLQFAKSKGYFISVFFFATKNPSINIKRVRYRVEHGGHGVPEDKIVSRYHRSMELMGSCFGVADAVFMIDASEDKFVLLFAVIDGKLTLTAERTETMWLGKYLPTHIIELL
ncbi:MAG: zeta toxin family protein [Helicobacteraceae bacterium]|jgi:predicted ABC-type ATPase|nr:zeta toxin family protein [Helicobacteraceae bacterium]